MPLFEKRVDFLIHLGNQKMMQRYQSRKVVYVLAGCMMHNYMLVYNLYMCVLYVCMCYICVYAYHADIHAHVPANPHLLYYIWFAFFASRILTRIYRFMYILVRPSFLEL